MWVTPDPEFANVLQSNQRNKRVATEQTLHISTLGPGTSIHFTECLTKSCQQGLH